MTAAPPTFTLAELVDATGGEIVGPSHNHLAPLCTDTRQLSNDSPAWYLPIVGERFNGHDFLKQAVESGAIGCIVGEAYRQQWLDCWEGQPPCPALIVADTTLAYQQVAGWYRQTRCPNTIVVGITGSNGKTTVKTMLATILSGVRNVIATEKNFNNDIGVPLTLLACQPETDILIVEMGMRGLGEIERLTQCAKPHIAIITNIGPAHIGRLGSLANIAQAKGEIFHGLTQHPKHTTLPPTAVFPKNEALLASYTNAFPKPVSATPFANQHEDNITRVIIDGVDFPVSSAVMASNVHLAVTVGKALGLTVQQCQQGLANCTPESGRGGAIKLVNPQNEQPNWLIDDAYNANPASMSASIQGLIHAYPNHIPILVLGGMKELGEFSTQYHAELGDVIHQALSGHGLNSNTVICLIGEELKATQVQLQQYDIQPHWQTELTDDFLKQLIKQLPRQPWAMLVKGSRSYGLDGLCEQVAQRYRQTLSLTK